jgi:hypothetical protein
MCGRTAGRRGGELLLLTGRDAAGCVAVGQVADILDSALRWAADWRANGQGSVVLGAVLLPLGWLWLLGRRPLQCLLVAVVAVARVAAVAAAGLAVPAVFAAAVVANAGVVVAATATSVTTVGTAAAVAVAAQVVGAVVACVAIQAASARSGGSPQPGPVSGINLLCS